MQSYNEIYAARQQAALKRMAQRMTEKIDQDIARVFYALLPCDICGQHYELPKDFQYSCRYDRPMCPQCWRTMHSKDKIL